MTNKETVMDEEFYEPQYDYSEDNYINEEVIEIDNYPEEVSVIKEEKVVLLDEDEIVEDKVKINVRGLRPITPAQCFIDGKAMTTVFFPRIQDEDGKKTLISTPYLITSAREKINLNSNDLMRLGYYTERNPNHEDRWSRDSVEKFLKGNRDENNLSSIFETIKKCYANHIDFGDLPWDDVLSCWIIGTYFHRAFSAYPYIHLNGSMAVGKSKTLTLSMLLAFNGEMGVTSSASYLTRCINDNNSSCGIDEAETLGGKDDNQTLIAIFNSGYKKGIYVGKSESSGKNGWKAKRFDPYSPKMFSGIKRLSPTLASRSIPITMVKTGNNVIKNSEVNTEDEIYQKVRDSLYFFMMENFESIIKIYNELSDTEITGREFELWKPILTIAKFISDDLYIKVRISALEIQAQKKGLIEEDTSSLQFLESIFALLDVMVVEEKGYYTAEDIHSFLTDSYDVSVNLNAESFEWMKGGKLHSRWIGDELRKTGVIKGSAVQKKIRGKNKRCFYLDKNVIEEKIKIYKEA